MTDTITEGATRQQQVAQAYLDAWNAHDGAAVLATFDPTGTYLDPALPGPIGGEHLAGHVAGLVAAFPDLHFMVEDVAVDGDRVILRCWECTHHAPPPHLLLISASRGIAPLYPRLGQLPCRWLARVGRVPAGHDLDKDTLARRRVLGEDHPHTRESTHHLVGLLRQLGEATHRPWDGDLLMTMAASGPAASGAPEEIICSSKAFSREPADPKKQGRWPPSGPGARPR
jgi:hypothetical protein